jgi:DNA-binding transcriptional ArsR family regulator
MAARPSTRHPSPATHPTPIRPPVRDFTGGANAFRIEWDVRSAYDFVFSLSSDAGSTDDLPAEDRRWLKKARTALAAQVRPEFDAVRDTEIEIHVASFIVERPEIRDADDVVDAISAATPRELLRSIFCDFTQDPTVAAIVDRIADGDTAGLADLRVAMPEWKKGLERLLVDPAATRERLIAILTAWRDLYHPVEERIRTIGERDHALRSEDRTTLSGPDLIERTTGGVRWLPEARIRRVILAPSYFSRPYNFLLAGSDWRFFGYPVADAALEVGDPLAPPRSVVRLHRALGDDTRMRILKLLAGRDLYLTEIAQQLDLSKPTIKHHLALLRAAGLVTVTEGGSVIYYSLKRDRLEDATIDLKRFLVG